jgi:hypothetical protein
MADEVAVTIEFRITGQPAQIRCALAETVISEHSGDAETTLLDASARIQRMTNQATTEVIKQLEGVRQAVRAHTKGHE